jgi:hypothetical protein
LWKEAEECGIVGVFDIVLRGVRKDVGRDVEDDAEVGLGFSPWHLIYMFIWNLTRLTPAVT